MQTEIFEESRPRLLAVASRILGSRADAEEAVQETWLRTAKVDEDIDNPAAWLTTVLSRVCLDMLRARRETVPLTHVEPADPQIGPDLEAQLADAVGSALNTVLESLNPAERVAFVLHDAFGVPFDDVATILGKSPAATRQVASRARKRVSTEPPSPGSPRTRAVSAFLAASRSGDFRALVELLDPDAVFRTFTDDEPPVLVSGAPAIAEAFMFRAKTALTVLIDGEVGAAVPDPSGETSRMVLIFDIAFAPGGAIASLDATWRAEELAVVAVGAVV